MKNIVDDFNEEIPYVQPNYISSGAIPPVMENPLEKYYRTMELTFALPSRGKWFGVDIPMTLDGEVEVRAMTASDELMMKNPDALLSGSAVLKVLQSCVPAMNGVKYLPMCDVEAALLAIRAASYGDSLMYEEACPSCKEIHEGSVSVRGLLARTSFLEGEYSIRLGDELVVMVRPISFHNQTRLSLASFEEAKKFQYLASLDTVTEEEKEKAMSDAVSRINELNYSLLLDSILGIVTPDGTVTDRNHIMGFLKNAPSRYVAELEKDLKTINSTGVDTKQHGVCSSCGHEWDFNISIDPSHFFG